MQSCDLGEQGFPNSSKEWWAKFSFSHPPLPPPLAKNAVFIELYLENCYLGGQEKLTFGRENHEEWPFCWKRFAHIC